MEYLLVSLFLLTSTTACPQIYISGNVTDQKGVSLIGANVFLAGTYEGAAIDAEGKFPLITEGTGEHTLVVTSLGCRRYEEGIFLEESSLTLSISMKEDVNLIDEVVFSGGSFEANDDKKAVILRPLDVVSNHNLSAVYKQFFEEMRSQIGLIYHFTSARKYDVPSKEKFQKARIQPYHDVSANFSFLFKSSVIFHFSVSNLLGFSQEFRSQYSTVPNENGVTILSRSCPRQSGSSSWGVL